MRRGVKERKSVAVEVLEEGTHFGRGEDERESCRGGDGTKCGVERPVGGAVEGVVELVLGWRRLEVEGCWSRE